MRMDLGAQRLSRRQFVQTVAAGGVVAMGAAGGGYALLRRAAKTPAASAAVHQYASRPDLAPPVVEILTAADGAAPGYVFLAPSSGPGQRGVMIMTSNGDVVWFHPTSPMTAMDFRPAVYRGRPVLTWWETLPGRGLGNGRHVIFDASYREIASFPAGAGRPADLHEFQITSRDTALVTALETRRMDIRRLGGSRKGLVMGGVAQELAIPSAKVLWEWRSLDHVAVAETYASKIGYPWDYFHINSVDVDVDGNLLVSGRNTWGVYKVNRQSGKVIWRLGGKRSDFRLGKGARFAFQHDARHIDRTTLTVFDNGGAERTQIESQSRGMQLHLDFKAMRATLAHEWAHEPPVYGRVMGNVQLLPNGNRFIGWGSDPHATEYTVDGKVVFDATLPHGGESYRAFRFPWQGTPLDPPVGVVAPASDGRAFHVSWNGATALAAWRLDTGSSDTSLSPAGTVPLQGFETILTLPSQSGYAQAVALDGQGSELSRTAIVPV